MNNLILLANEYPFGNWEPYLETEVKYYKGFDRVCICSLQLRKEHKHTKRALPSNEIEVCEVDKVPPFIYFLYSLRTLIDKNLYCELHRLISEKRFTLKRFIKVMIYFSRSYYEKNVILRFLKRRHWLDSNKKSIGGGTSTPIVSNTNRMLDSFLQSTCRDTKLLPEHIDLICMKKKGISLTFL